MTSLNQDFEFFKTHKDELVEKYNRRWVVIKDAKITGDYDTQIDALKDASDKFEIGTFIIQFVDSDDASISQTFHSRVVI